MKTTKSHLLTVAALGAILLGSSANIGAQRAVDYREPGDVIRLEVSFDGPDAARIKTVAVYLRDLNGLSSDQQGFMTQFNSNAVGPAHASTFDVSVQIPQSAATGEYAVFVIATTDNNSLRYDSGDQFKVATYHIRNKSGFPPPHINVKELPKT